MSLFSIDRSLLLSRQSTVEGFVPTAGSALQRLSLDGSIGQELPDLQLPAPGTYDLRQIVLDGVARFNPEYDLSGEPGYDAPDRGDAPPDPTVGLQVTTRLIVGSVQPADDDGVDFDFPERDFADAFLGSRDGGPIDIPEGPIGFDGVESPDFAPSPTEPNTILDTAEAITFPANFFVPRDPIEIQLLDLDPISPAGGLGASDPSDDFATELSSPSSLPTLSLQRILVPDADPIVRSVPPAEVEAIELVGVQAPAGEDAIVFG